MQHGYKYDNIFVFYLATKATTISTDNCLIEIAGTRYGHCEKRRYGAIEEHKSNSYNTKICLYISRNFYYIDLNYPTCGFLNNIFRCHNEYKQLDARKILFNYKSVPGMIMAVECNRGTTHVSLRA